MRFTSVLVLTGALYAADLALAGCAADNCLRAVRASAFPTRSGTADCSSFFSATVRQRTSTTTINTGGTTITTAGAYLETSNPTAIPSYASACSGSARYSSACACIGVIRVTTTVSPPTPTTSDIINAVFVVSPEGCPRSTPTGSVIGQSDDAFSQQNGGLSYQQYEGNQVVLQDPTNGPFFLDLSREDRIAISDDAGNTLVIYQNGTFEAFAGNCQISVVGTVLEENGVSKRHNLLMSRQSSPVCDAVQFFCNSRFSLIFAGAAGKALCNGIGVQVGGLIGRQIGGAIGFLGNVFGPEVGVPTTLLGVFIGGRLGASKFSEYLCAGVGAYLGEKLCEYCKEDVECGPGQISCNKGPCQDALSDPNNCGGCGNKCASGICSNGQCSVEACNGSSCGSLNGCGVSCFCFREASGNGFCGPNVPCAPLAGCSSNAECAQGEVCAISTCCNRPVCLSGCALARRSLGDGYVNSTEFEDGWTAGTPSLF
ncbi:hypothetical protein EYR41_008635 [Orbilia oligospora]|uniref:Uncharacterized protein n=1 Tax=Orbilia oligospora TaxID=2813651 RepID=A0A7C8K3L2_ORBOL|nr:hypothetical protein TWF751_010592 [Orbilia oligospora]KAF3285749.1 hypothetical protein TWF132_009114 [Orbilia oligospora]TGJ67053.1 hypothetical protein EYR41_008635 [Orbilia oligospora]